MFINNLVVVVLPDPFQGMRAWRKEKLHGVPTVGPRPKVWLEVKNRRSSAKNGAPERLGYGTIQEVN